MADVLLAAHAVSVRFGGLIALDGVDLEVNARALIGMKRDRAVPDVTEETGCAGR